jgi:hypothetical protein
MRKEKKNDEDDDDALTAADAIRWWFVSVFCGSFWFLLTTALDP